MLKNYVANFMSTRETRSVVIRAIGIVEDYACVHIVESTHVKCIIGCSICKVPLLLR